MNSYSFPKCLNPFLGMPVAKLCASQHAYIACSPHLPITTEQVPQVRVVREIEFAFCYGLLLPQLGGAWK